MDLDEIVITDLSENHQEYARVIGVQNLIKLSKEFGGTPIYIPKIEELIKYKRYKLITEEFNGGNISFLATKYGVSRTTVYNILRNKLKDGRSKKVMTGQISILEFLSEKEEET